MKFKYFSMFSGIGGFEVGIGDRGECIGYSEIDKYARQIYEKHYPNHINYGDATKIRTKEIPDFNLLVGGFPCQAFSIAGKQRGFCDSRGTLFFEIARILEAKKPKHFLLENVRGLLSNDKGRTFQTILRVLTDMGYNIEWALLNSKDFGVPQNRERVFIVGYLGRKCRRQILPVTGGNKQNIKQLISGSQGNRVMDINGVSCTLSSNGGGQGAKTGLYCVGNVNPSGKGMNGNVYSANGLNPTLTINKGEGPKIAIPVLTPDRMNKRQNGRRFKTNGEPAFTCTAQDRHGVYNGMKIRRLTPVECERLQGFPDNWTEGISDTQRYKCLGNAVTTTVIDAIITKLVEVMS